MPSTSGGGALGRSVTRAASLQSYLTVRWLADRAYREDAFALYAYFRWLDDEVDEHLPGTQERLAFVGRQRALVESLAHDEPAGLTPQELLLVGLLHRRADAGGARRSVDAMLDAMEFDAARRGHPVTGAQLDRYTRDLAVAVTEAIHHCIGHGAPAPQDESRYVAVTGAHVAHMLRDLREDLAAGYVNVPVEVLPGGRPPHAGTGSPELCAWVRGRVALARACFAEGREYLARVGNARARLAGHAYIARFEWVLDRVERDGYRLRAAYPERATLRGGVAIGAAAARSALAARRRAAGGAL
jgi:phytoene/squalene synthetase